MGEAYNDSDVSGYLALPGQGAAPGVLVLHAWWGLNDFFRSFCDRLAAEGFTVFAPDLYAGQVAQTIEEAETLMRGMDDEAAQRAIAAAIQLLLRHPRTRGSHLGAVGFSMGGSWALTLGEAVKAIVIYYGTSAADDVRAETAIQGHFAGQDPFEPAEGVRALEAALSERGTRVEFFEYPSAQHWFFEADRPEFDPQASALAWERMVEFLRRELGEGDRG